MHLVNGIELALLEVLLFALATFTLRVSTNFYKINGFVYYWSMFTILTGIWELFFVLNYSRVNGISNHLLDSKTHVWTSNYSLALLNPNNFSQIFYAEYGAYADREYMTSTDTWSRVIESSHSLMCGFFCLLAMMNFLCDKWGEYIFSLSVAMGSQLMNSILYMANYFNQVRERDNVNFNTTSFPSGKFLEKRPFMYINVFWTLCPLIIIFYLLDILNQRKSKYSYYNLGPSIKKTEKQLLMEYEA